MASTTRNHSTGRVLRREATRVQRVCVVQNAETCGRDIPGQVLHRRAAITAVSSTALALLVPKQASAELETSLSALSGKDYGKERMKFGDYVETPSGLQYFDFREGTGKQPKKGDLCVVDWTGVTIGYYGRPFEARNKAKGSAFNDDDKDFFRFRLGEDQVILGFQEAVAGMKEGGIRRIIVPWGELSYPDGDFKHWGPRPNTFSGERALGFVVEGKNNMIDKTLAFDIKLVRVDD